METKTVFMFFFNMIFIKNVFTQCIGSPVFIPEPYGVAAGIPIAGVPTAGIPIAGFPTAGIPTAAIPIAGVPTAGLPIASVATAAIPAAGIQTPFTSQLAMSSPILPSPSFSIISDDLAVEGIVAVTGSLPFLGTVTLGGTVPAIGEGTVNYNCGNGEVGLVREAPAVAAPIAIY